MVQRRRSSGCADVHPDAAAEFIIVSEQSGDTGRQLQVKNAEAYVVLQDFAQVYDWPVAEYETVALVNSYIRAGAVRRHAIYRILVGIAGPDWQLIQVFQIQAIRAEPLHILNGLFQFLPGQPRYLRRLLPRETAR